MNKYIQRFLFLSLAVCALSLTSCKDEPDKYEVADGLPVVNYIRCLSSEVKSNTDTEDTKYTNGELVESAYPSSTLCLIGENLRSVVKIFFNDLEASLNTSYVTDNTLIVNVPGNVPGEVSNKIYLVTRSGEQVEVPFQVIISAPTVSSMSCEYAPAGSTATIYGGYIIDDPNKPLTVTFKDAAGQDVNATDVEVAADYSSVSFTVPETAAPGTITVTSVYGATTAPFRYCDTRGMLFDFDGLTGLSNHGWHDQVITSDETSLTGNFLQLGNGTAAMDDTTWDDGSFSFEYWAGSWNTPTDYPEREGVRLFDLADFSDLGNMAIKFELFVPSSNPWSAAALQVIPAKVSEVSMGSAGTDIYGNAVAGCNNTYISGDDCPRALYRPWTTAANGSYDTGDKWVTVSLPITSTFLYGYSGASAKNAVSEASFASLVFFLCGGGVTGTPCTPILKIDNIRAVPYK